MNTALAVGVPRGLLHFTAADGARWVARLAEAEFGGVNAGVWFFAGEPVRVPAPGRKGVEAWADDWLDQGTPGERMRGVYPDNAVRRLLEKQAFRDTYALRLAPTLEAVLDASASLEGHTVAVVLLTEAPADGAAVVSTLKRASRYPLFWVFIGAGASGDESCYLGVLDTLGDEPEDPANLTVLKVDNWSSVTQWFTARRVRRAVDRWRRATPTG